MLGMAATCPARKQLSRAFETAATSGLSISLLLNSSIPERKWVLFHFHKYHRKNLINCTSCQALISAPRHATTPSRVGSRFIWVGTHVPQAVSPQHSMPLRSGKNLLEKLLMIHEQLRESLRVSLPAENSVRPAKAPILGVRRYWLAMQLPLMLRSPLAEKSTP